MSDIHEFILHNVSNFDLSSINRERKTHLLDTSIDNLVKCSTVAAAGTLQDSACCIRILTRDKLCLGQLVQEPNLTVLVDRAFPGDKLEISSNQQLLVAIECVKSLSNIVFQCNQVVDFLKSLSITDQLSRRLAQYIPSNRLDVVDCTNLLLYDLKLLFLLTGVDQSIRLDLVRQPLCQNASSPYVCKPLLAILLDILQHYYSVGRLDQAVDAEIVSECFKVVFNLYLGLQKTNYSDQIDQTKTGYTLLPDYACLTRNLLLNPSSDQQNCLMILNASIDFINIIPDQYLVWLLTGSQDSTLPLCPVATTNNGSVKSDVENGHEVRFGLEKAIQLVNLLLTLLQDRLVKLDSSSTPSVDCSVNYRVGEDVYRVVAALTNICRGCRPMCRYCKNKILPKLGVEVKELPEKGNTLRNRLCKQLTGPSVNLSEACALFIFVLCKGSINRAIKYTGFGNYAGFLARNSLLSGGGDGNGSSTNCRGDSSSSESDTEEYVQLKDQVNAVTGRWEEPKPSPMQGMSEEQKERVAMELVDKIDRLQREGLIQPGTVGEDGKIRPVEHVLELIKDQPDPDPASSSDSD